MSDIENVGRPVRVLTPEEIKEVELLSSYLTQDQIAGHLGIGVATFQRIVQRDAVVAIAYLRGKAKTIAQIANNMVMQALDGDFAAMKFFLQTRGGWNETVTQEHVSPDGSMSPKAGDGPVAIYALPDNGRGPVLLDPEPEPEPEPAPKAKRKPAAKRSAAKKKPAVKRSAPKRRDKK